VRDSYIRGLVEIIIENALKGNSLETDSDPSPDKVPGFGISEVKLLSAGFLNTRTVHNSACIRVEKR
jgi:hypothetical protein